MECTEKDVLRALNYWHEAGLLKIDYDASGNICGLSIGKASKASAPAAKPAVSAPAKRASATQEDLRQLYFVAEQYMGKPLSVSEIKKILRFHLPQFFIVKNCLLKFPFTFIQLSLYIQKALIGWLE